MAPDAEFSATETLVTSETRIQVLSGPSDWYLNCSCFTVAAAFAAAPQWEVAMWIEKIRHGVLEVQTDKGLVYLRPSLAERVQLLWTFRNFQLLPQQVLKPRELTLVASLLKRRTISCLGECRIGTIEWPLPSAVHAAGTLQESGPAAANTSSPCPTKQTNNRRYRRKRSKRASIPQLSATTTCPSRPG